LWNLVYKLNDKITFDPLKRPEDGKSGKSRVRDIRVHGNPG
jgi:hypothetical protein